MTRDPLSRKAVSLAPSGIRKFFDIVSEMEDAISWAWASRTLTRPGASGRRASTPWREDALSTRPTQGCGSEGGDQPLPGPHHTDPLWPGRGSAGHRGRQRGHRPGLRAMLDAGDEVLIPQPSYVSYLPCAVLADGVPVTIPLQEEERLPPDPEELEAAITPRQRSWCSPSPTTPPGQS